MSNSEIKYLKEVLVFLDYVYGFYGPEGVYPMNATIPQIGKATQVLLKQYGKNVNFDSIDRERVRDILIEQFGLVFPQ